ncbi:rubrerythrin family protein [Streptomyces sp. SUK 48]|uniref:rubrerythrin family protein n=1 Tax=Streptomyces sp. SUK 48 TaxID=2582831 RepID=UPI00129B06FF|nr:rubrerythrin family protein [Streptomyces sp. SUK 48]
MSAELKNTTTYANLKTAFAAEAQAYMRYVYFAELADEEGRPYIAELFRDTANSETGRAKGHLDYLKQVGDPVTGQPIGDTGKNLVAAIADKTQRAGELYAGFAETAREEGLDDIAGCFETLVQAHKKQAGRFKKGLESLDF